ncbi:MAG: hypothetical protein CME26_13425 [Gemmatimonadetes bacterium]|nr:hypothetical protein [Gemmatimonadota bacterium]
MSEGESRRIWLVLEEVFLVLSVFVLWPRILNWPGLLWEVLQYLALVGLVWILIRRVRRYQKPRGE